MSVLRVVTASTDSSSSRSSSAEARTNSQRGSPPAISRQTSRTSSETSLKTTAPSSPTSPSAPSPIKPSPHPTSRTVSPGLIPAPASTRVRNSSNIACDSLRASSLPPKRRSASHVAQRSGTFAQKRFHVQGPRVHLHTDTLARPGPLLLRPVPVELDPVLVRIAEVDRLADAVVARAAQRDPGLEHAADGIAERGARRVADRDVVEARRPRRRRRRTLGLPRVQADVMVVAARGHERGRVAHSLHHVEAENVAVDRKSVV